MKLNKLTFPDEYLNASSDACEEFREIMHW